MIKLLSQNLRKNGFILYNNPQYKQYTNRIMYKFSGQMDYSKDYFQILNVNQNSSNEEIKKEYYKLVKQYHPDINKNNEEYFKLINQAYEVLSDENKKREYISMRSNPFQNNPNGNTSQTGGSQQSTYGRYYQYGNKRNQSYDYKRYEQSYYSTSQAQREQQQGEFYNSTFSKSQFYQEMNNPYSNNNDYETRYSAEEKIRNTKKKIIAFTFVILGFYMIFDVLVYRILNTGPQYRIHDPQTGQTFITDASTFQQLQQRGYDPSFISPNDRDLQNRYGRRQDERYSYQNNFKYDTSREKL